MPRRALLTLSCLLLPLLAPASGADSATLVGHLPGGRYGAAQAWDGRFVYLFGGNGPSGLLDEILRYDSTTGVVERMAARLPEPLVDAAGFWADGRAYVLGGDTSHGAVDRIVEYDPVADAVTTLPAHLPAKAYLGASAWDGHRLWIFGGLEPQGAQVRASARIAWFDPATGQAGASNASLPTPRFEEGAFWDGHLAYVMGGATDTGELLQIVRFDPSNESVAIAPRNLPGQRDDFGVAWTGRVALLFGGFIGGVVGQSPAILAYDPATGVTTTMAATLPNGRESMAVVWDGQRAHLLGGFGGPFTQLVTGSDLDEILLYTLEPGAPASVSAQAEPDGVRVAWSAPAANSCFEPASAYLVYRETPGSDPVLLARLGDVRAFTDPDPPAGVVGYAVQAENAAGPGPLTSPAWVFVAPQA